MNLNTEIFPVNNHRQTKTNIGYSLTLSNQKRLFSKRRRRSFDENKNNHTDSFLPSIIISNNNNDNIVDGHKPYRRNDFANNHLFIAKQKLARLFLNQSTNNTQTKTELMNLFDQPKQKVRSKSRNKRQDNNSDSKSISTIDRDIHLSVVNLIMKPSVTNRRPESINLPIKKSSSSLEWINPANNQYFQTTADHLNENDLEAKTFTTELMVQKLH